MLDRLLVGDFWLLYFPFEDDFTLDHPTIGKFGFLSIHRQVWSLSFPLGDDFTLDRPLIGNFGRCPSLLGMTLYWIVHL